MYFQGSGQRIGLMVQAAANMVTSLVIAFVYGWKLAFVVLGFLPLLVISGIVQGSLMKGFSKSDHDALEEGGKVLVLSDLSSFIIQLMTDKAPGYS